MWTQQMGSRTLIRTEPNGTSEQNLLKQPNSQSDCTAASAQLPQHLDGQRGQLKGVHVVWGERRGEERGEEGQPWVTSWPESTAWARSHGKSLEELPLGA